MTATTPPRSKLVGARLRAAWLWVAATAVLALAGCGSTPSRPPEASRPAPSASAPDDSRPTPARRGGGYYKDDGPDESPPPNLDDIPDAQPRPEPLHRFANRPYNVFGQDYVPATERRPHRERGMASWYGRRFKGNPTSSGEPYDMYAMTAAHPTLPIPSYVRVTNVANRRSVVVRVNDRGPFHKGRIIDLSYTAAHKLGYVNAGSAMVEIEAILPDEIDVVKPDKPVPPLRGRSPVLADASPPASAPAVAPAAPPPADRTADATARGVFLQLGAFATANNAEDFRNMVRQALAVHDERLELSDQGGRYRLHLGPFASADEARSEARRIGQLLKIQAFVVMR